MEQLICKNCKRELGEVDKIDYNYLSISADPIEIDHAVLKLNFFHTCTFCNTKLIVSVTASCVSAICKKLISSQKPYERRTYTMLTKKIDLSVDAWDWNTYELEGESE